MIKMTPVIIYLIIINIVSFVAYGCDKFKARKGKFRISEKSLLMLALFGGCIGALFGMHLFRHKTRKIKFVLGIPLIIVVQCVVIYMIYRVYG